MPRNLDCRLEQGGQLSTLDAKLGLIRAWTCSTQEEDGLLGTHCGGPDESSSVDFNLPSLVQQKEMKWMLGVHHPKA